MIEGIPLSILDLGGWGVALLVIVTVAFMVYRGLLVPRSTHETFVEAWKTEREAGRERDQQAVQTTELAKTTVALLESIKETGKGSS